MPSGDIRAYISTIPSESHIEATIALNEVKIFRSSAWVQLSDGTRKMMECAMYFATPPSEDQRKEYSGHKGFVGGVHIVPKSSAAGGAKKKKKKEQKK